MINDIKWGCVQICANGGSSKPWVSFRNIDLDDLGYPYYCGNLRSLTWPRPRRFASAGSAVNVDTLQDFAEYLVASNIVRYMYPPSIEPGKGNSLMDGGLMRKSTTVYMMDFPAKHS